tara:strand:- start:1198 stop:1677 length:480 start_codon:yes stop_codon:yes gene_type:complete
MAIASLIASENISAGNAVYVTSTGQAALAKADTVTNASVLGIAVDTVSSGGILRINADGVYTGYSGLTPGDFRYLSVLTPGLLISFSEFAAELASVSIDAFLTNVGRVVTPTTLSIETMPPQLIANPNSVILLEGSVGLLIEALLLEDGSTIDLETASA